MSEINMIEINNEDAWDVIRGMLNAGYQVMLWRDELGESVEIEYTHPSWDGECFKKTGYEGTWWTERVCDARYQTREED